MTIKSIARAAVLTVALPLTMTNALAQGKGQGQGQGQPPATGSSSPAVAIKMEIPDLGGAAVQGIDVFSYDFQSTQTTSSSGGSGGGAGKLEFGPLTVSKRIDNLTPAINLRNFSGQHVGDVTLHWFRVDASGVLSQQFLMIKLVDAAISTIHTRLPNQHDSKAADLGEVEEITFTFKDIQISFGPLAP